MHASDIGRVVLLLFFFLYFPRAEEADRYVASLGGERDGKFREKRRH